MNSGEDARFSKGSNSVEYDGSLNRSQCPSIVASSSGRWSEHVSESASLHAYQESRTSTASFIARLRSQQTCLTSPPRVTFRGHLEGAGENDKEGGGTTEEPIVHRRLFRFYTVSDLQSRKKTESSPINCTNIVPEISLTPTKRPLDELGGHSHSPTKQSKESCNLTRRSSNKTSSTERRNSDRLALQKLVGVARRRSYERCPGGKSPQLSVCSRTPPSKPSQPSRPHSPAESSGGVKMGSSVAFRTHAGTHFGDCENKLRDSMKDLSGDNGSGAAGTSNSSITLGRDPKTYKPDKSRKQLYPGTKYTPMNEDSKQGQRVVRRHSTLDQFNSKGNKMNVTDLLNRRRARSKSPCSNDLDLHGVPGEPAQYRTSMPDRIRAQRYSPRGDRVGNDTNVDKLLLGNSFPCRDFRSATHSPRPTSRNVSIDSFRYARYDKDHQEENGDLGESCIFSVPLNQYTHTHSQRDTLQGNDHREGWDDDDNGKANMRSSEMEIPGILKNISLSLPISNQSCKTSRTTSPESNLSTLSNMGPGCPSRTVDAANNHPPPMINRPISISGKVSPASMAWERSHRSSINTAPGATAMEAKSSFFKEEAFIGGSPRDGGRGDFSTGAGDTKGEYRVSREAATKSGSVNRKSNMSYQSISYGPHRERRRSSFSWEDWMVPDEEYDSMAPQSKESSERHIGRGDSSRSMSRASANLIHAATTSLQAGEVVNKAGVSRGFGRPMGTVMGALKGIASTSRASMRGSSISVFALQNSVADVLTQDVANDNSTSLPIRGYVSLRVSENSFFHQSSHSWMDISYLQSSAFLLRVLGIVPWYPSMVSISAPLGRPKGEIYDWKRDRRYIRWKSLHYLSILYIILWEAGLMYEIYYTCSSTYGRDIRSVTIRDTFEVIVVISSFLGHACCVSFFATNTFGTLVTYAYRNGFIQTLSSLSIRYLALAWVLAFVMIVALDYNKWFLCINWGLMFTWATTLIVTIIFCSFGLDAFALVVVDASGLEGLVEGFNLLNAVMRRVAYSVQFSLTVFSTTIFFMILTTLLNIFNIDTPMSEAIISYVWAGAIFLVGLGTLIAIAMVNTKCLRLPALVHSLSFGSEINHDKWCVAAHIRGCDAGFFVYNMPVTIAAVFKFTYAIMGISIFLFSGAFRKTKKQE